MAEAQRQVYAAYWLTMGVIWLLACHFVCVVYSHWQDADPRQQTPYNAQVDEKEQVEMQ